MKNFYNKLKQDDQELLEDADEDGGRSEEAIVNIFLIWWEQRNLTVIIEIM